MVVPSGCRTSEAVPEFLEKARREQTQPGISQRISRGQDKFVVGGLFRADPFGTDKQGGALLRRQESRGPLLRLQSKIWVECELATNGHSVAWVQLRAKRKARMIVPDPNQKSGGRISQVQFQIRLLIASQFLDQTLHLDMDRS